MMILFFIVCTFAFVQCNTSYKKAEVFGLLEQIVETKYGGDQKRSKCMMKHLKDKTKHKNLAINVSSTINEDEFEVLMKPAIDVAVIDCTAYSWFIFFISAISLLALICLSIFMIDCICNKVKVKEPEVQEKQPSI